MKPELKSKLDKNDKPKRILALDGGGIRGALTLGYLEKLESLLRSRFNKPGLKLCDYFDLIGGTSTGAIIASCLATGMEVKTVIELYEQFGKEIFGKRRFNWIPRSWTTPRSFMKASYKSSKLEGLLREFLKEITIGDGDNVCCGLALTSKRADTYSLWTVTNHPDGEFYEANKNLKLWELCRASSAAPYYFAPKALPITTRKGISIETAFIDGGVSLANNPAFQLFLMTLIPEFGYKWKAGEDEMFIVSFGTGNGEQREEAKGILKRSALGWAPKLADIFMSDAMELNQAIMQLFGTNYGDPEIIDSTYGDLRTVQLPSSRLFSFSRFNVRLSEKGLANIGVTTMNDRVKALTQLDHYENIPALLEIGRKGAEKLTDPNIPMKFDI